jgi:L,D-transpeptidase ErfK/SrfK
MFRTQEQLKRLAAVSSVIAIAAAEAFAQETAPRAARRVVVSIPDRKLAVLQDDRVLRVFPTAVGAPNSPSPVGQFTIVRRVVDPTWYGKGKVVGPGKNNPVGTRWIGLSVKGYGIHGTNAPASIGHNVSHGCIRLRNRDVEELFTMVSVGDAVELHNGRSPELDRIFAPATVATDDAGGQ